MCRASPETGWDGSNPASTAPPLSVPGLQPVAMASLDASALLQAQEVFAERGPLPTRHKVVGYPIGCMVAWQKPSALMGCLSQGMVSKQLQGAGQSATRQPCKRLCQLSSAAGLQRGIVAQMHEELSSATETLQADAAHWQGQWEEAEGQLQAQQGLALQLEQELKARPTTQQVTLRCTPG